MVKRLILFLSVLYIAIPSFVFAKTDFHKFQDEVNIKHRVLGDAIVAGGNIVVNSNIDGDLIGAGGSISITAPIDKDVRVLGIDVFINSSIGENITVFAENINFGNLSHIGGDAYITGNFLSFSGESKGNMYFSGSDVVIDGKIDGDVDLGEIKGLKFGTDAKIGGNLIYKSNKSFEIPEGIVAGEIKYQKLRGKVSVFSNVDWFLKTVQFFAILSLGIIIINFFDKQTGRILFLMVKNPFNTLLLGIIFCILAPIASILLIITLIGIPIGLIILFLWALLVYISQVFVSIIFGRWFFKSFIYREENKSNINILWFLVIGLLCVQFLYIIPFIGAFSRVLVMFWGFGGVVSFFKEYITNKYV